MTRNKIIASIALLAIVIAAGALTIRHETTNLIKSSENELGGATEKTILNIKDRIEQEEIEYNKAKLQDEIKKQQYDMLAFENSLASVEKPAIEACLKQEKIMAQLKAGAATIFEAYEATSLAKEQCEKINKEIRFIRVPSELSKAAQELLEGVKADLIAGYDKRAKALEYMLKFIDDGKPSYEHKFNEALKNARQFSTGAALSIIEAKKQIGIDILQQEMARTGDFKEAGCNYRINGVFYSNKKPFVFINGGMYYINDSICEGKITGIGPNKVTIRFLDRQRDYIVGETITTR